MILQILTVAKKCVVRNYADSGLHDTWSIVCVLNSSLRLLEEYSPLCTWSLLLNPILGRLTMLEHLIATLISTTFCLSSLLEF